MNEQLKKDALILCERIRELTKQVDKKIENINITNILFIRV